MKQSVSENLTNFLKPRLSIEASREASELIYQCCEIREERGKDDPELALRLLGLLDVLETDLPATEYERARAIILETTTPSETLAADARIQVRGRMHEWNRALAETRPILGEHALAMDNAGELYAGALQMMGHTTPAGLTNGAARALFRHLTGQSVAPRAESAGESLEDWLGVPAPRKL